MKNRLILITSCLLLISFSNTKKVFVNPDMKLHWKYSLGKTTHRTEVAFFNNSIFIGSNGSHFMDWSIDNGNGVVELNRSTGKKIKSIANEKFGDMDVNGVLRYKQTVIFGNDNDEVLCYSKAGELKWRLPTSGDVEHTPTLIKSPQHGDMIVYATETGEVRAINPHDGSTFWKHYSDDFTGWKRGDNRSVFKIKMHFTSGEIYFSKPAIFDLNEDGCDDLVYRSSDEYVGINGRNGKILWKIGNTKFKGYSLKGLRETPNVSRVKGKVVLTMSFVNHITDKIKIVQMDQKGNLVNRRELNYLSYGESLNHTDDLFYVNGMFFDLNTLKPHRLPFFENDHEGAVFRFSGDAQISRERVRINNEEAIGIIFQYDSEVVGLSKFMLIGVKSKKVYMKTHIAGGSEFTPILRDVNLDGKIDLLVGSWDKNLYCYDLNIDAENIIK